MTKRHICIVGACRAASSLSSACLPLRHAQPKREPRRERKFQQPVLVTSSGQALDAFTVKTLLGRAGVNANYDPRRPRRRSTTSRRVIIAVGASNKGFGQAGITAETEMARTKAILDAAKAKGIAVICVHIGGAERRKGLSVQFVELVCPAADHMVVSKDGNEDDYFSELSKQNGNSADRHRASARRRQDARFLIAQS